jgi:hypothetical protein
MNDMGTLGILPVSPWSAAALVVAAGLFSLLIFIAGIVLGHRMARGLSPLDVPQFLRFGKPVEKQAKPLPTISG